LPLVRADHDHAIDAWQWVLRLDPGASAEVQVAALFHDIERLRSEARARVEQHAPDYQAFKDRHARRGAHDVPPPLEAAPGDVARLCDRVRRHERADADPERTLLADADVLSFFALNSAGYLAYFGPDATRNKVAYSLGRASPRVRRWLVRIRMPLV